MESMSPAAMAVCMKVVRSGQYGLVTTARIFGRREAICSGVMVPGAV